MGNNVPTLQDLIYKLIGLDDRLRSLEDRVGVIETNTIDHESRLQDLEEAEDERQES